MDAIRAFLTIIILLHHLGLKNLIKILIPSLIDGGNWPLAVDFFFLLSGFVLCKSFFKIKRNIFKFIVIRAFRLMPVSIFTLIIFLILNYLSSRSYSYNFHEIFSNFFLIQSFNSEKSLPVTMWSASFEMWLPCFFYFTGFVRSLNIKISFALLSFLLFWQGFIYLSPLQEEGLGAFARAFSGLLSGFVLACLSLKHEEILNKYSEKFLWAGSLFFVFAISCMLFSSNFEIVRFIFPFFAASSIYFLYNSEFLYGSRLSPFMSKLVKFFASRSYCIYLIQMPIISFFYSFNIPTSFPGDIYSRIILLYLIIISSELIYRYVEFPVQNLRKKIKFLI